MTLRIQVLVNFGGAETGEIRILPGEYAIDDERLLGLGNVLLERGQARVIGDERVNEEALDEFLATHAPDVPEVQFTIDDEPVNKQLDEAFTASEESEAVDEAVSDEAEDEPEDDDSDDTPQTGRKRKAR